MPRMAEQQLSVAANSVSTNRLNGKLYEILSRPANLLLAAAASVTGLLVTFLIDGVAVVNDEAVSRGNRFPVIPDDVVTEEQGVGRLSLVFRNSTGAAITVDWSLDVDFLA